MSCFDYSQPLTVLVGDRFDELDEQKQLLDVLIRTETDHGWPTAKARRHLQVTWGLELSTPPDNGF